MTNRFSLTGLLFAGVAATLLGSGAVVAQSNDFIALQDSVISELNSLQVNADSVPMMSMASVTELASILGGSDPDAERKAAAERVIENAMNPETASLTSEGGMQMVAKLKVDLNSAGLEYPEGKLTFSQVQQLSSVFQGGKGTASPKETAEMMLSGFLQPKLADSADSGATQLEAQLAAKFTEVGLDVPDWNMVSFSQVSQLTAVFDGKKTNLEQKAAAMAILENNN